MVTGWRIAKSKYASQAFDGEGARLYGGRWNSIGVRMVYTAQNASLAVLEILVHLNDSNLLTAYSLCAVHLDESLVQHLDRSRLPDNWREYPAPPELQRIGDEWISNRSSLVLEVPNAIVESESDYLINPSYPDFLSLAIDAPIPFSFDARLVR